MKVATPDTMSDMDTRKLVVSVSSLSALAIMSGGVTMATNMANRCWAAAKSVSRKGRTVVESVYQTALGHFGLLGCCIICRSHRPLF